MVHGLYRLMESTESLPINIGNPIERTVLEIADVVNQLTGNRCDHEFHPLPENDPLQRRPDITKAKEILGWQPVISRSEGLKRTYEYFKNLPREEWFKQPKFL